MKKLVVLAMLLMVPTMAYYQKRYFVEKLQGQAREDVERMLAEGGVEDAVVRVDWMDVRVGGVVDTVEHQEALGRAIDDLEGLRLAPGGNGLQVRGWIGLSREGGKWRVVGLMPEDFEMGLWDGVELAPDGDAGLERLRAVEAPAGMEEWMRFAEAYYEAPGNRMVRLEDGGLVLAGEATAELRLEWLSEAAKLVGRERVEESFRILPSLYHFAGYLPESSRGAAEVARLREEMRGLSVLFAGASVELEEGERERVSEAAGVMLQAGNRVRFVVGVTAAEGSEGGLARARQRLETVVSLLRDYGVAETRLVRQVFVVTVDGPRAGQVEFLLK